MTTQLFKTRQLTDYRNWPTGERGCLFYVENTPIITERSQGAVYLIDTPWRDGDKIGEYDTLHQTEINMLLKLQPVAQGFAAFLLTQNYQKWQANRNILNHWWKSYYEWCCNLHPESGCEVEYIVQECLNWTIRTKDLMKCFLYDLGMENAYHDAYLHIIRHVFHSNNSIELAMKNLLPYMTILEQNYIRYDYASNALCMQGKKLIIGAQAMIIQYAAVRNMIVVINTATNLDHVVEYILDRLSDTPPHTVSVANVRMPSFETKEAHKLYKYAWDVNAHRVRSEFSNNIRFETLSEEQQTSEVAKELFFREVRHLDNTLLMEWISQEELSKIRTFLSGYLTFLMKKIKNTNDVQQAQKILENKFPEIFGKQEVQVPTKEQDYSALILNNSLKDKLHQVYEILMCENFLQSNEEDKFIRIMTCKPMLGEKMMWKGKKSELATFIKYAYLNSPIAPWSVADSWVCKGEIVTPKMLSNNCRGTIGEWKKKFKI